MMNILRQNQILWVAVALAGCGRPAAVPAPVPAAPAPAPTFAADVAPVLARDCLGCHDAANPAGKLALDAFADDPADPKHRATWARVADALHTGAMPPLGEPSPDAGERARLVAWLATVAADGPEKAAPARVRRLNRAEYDNTTRDLLGVDLRLAEGFPADDVGHGFDNNGDVQATPTILVERYLDAAETLVDRAFEDPDARRRLLEPGPDSYPFAFRRFTPPSRSGPVKRVNTRPAAVDPELLRQQRVYDTLRAFADRAFRRPATHDELSRLLGVVLAAEKDGEAAESALKLGLRAALASPRFLFRVEGTDDAETTGPPSPENDFALASRLSYFLWSSTPDDALLRLAARAELRRGSVLRAQALRMLRDGRARALADNFGGQWLRVRSLRAFAPDPSLFPGFDEPLRAAMLEEASRFFAAVVAEDQSVLKFLDADFTFVNERLARHYGLDGVSGERFRRVSLAGTPRGGVLTMAAVLAATSNPTRTSPVTRGKWVLDALLGAPTPPPPAGVEALKDDHGGGDGAPASLRSRLERHRADPACASCHARMDPLGFALENFDATGAWRDRDEAAPVDASGVLPGGRAFRGPGGLKAVLLSRPDAFARALTEKALAYALGRAPTRAERPEIDRVVAALAADGYRFSTLVLGVVESAPFRQGGASGPPLRD